MRVMGCQKAQRKVGCEGLEEEEVMSQEERVVSQEENLFGTRPIGKLLLKFSFPCVLSMLVSALYNIVDQIFIGQGVGFLGMRRPMSCIRLR